MAVVVKSPPYPLPRLRGNPLFGMRRLFEREKRLLRYYSPPKAVLVVRFQLGVIGRLDKSGREFDELIF